MKNPIELTDEEKRELLKSEKNPLLKVKDIWDSLPVRPDARVDRIKGNPVVTVGLRFSF